MKSSRIYSAIAFVIAACNVLMKNRVTLVKTKDTNVTNGTKGGSNHASFCRRSNHDNSSETLLIWLNETQVLI